MQRIVWQKTKKARLQATFAGVYSFVSKRTHMLQKFLFTCAVFLVAFSCTYDSLEDKSNNPELIIKVGTICGWGAVNDTLTIIGDCAVRYVNYTRESAGKPMVKNGVIKPSELEALIDQLNFVEFKKLELNTCNVCFDGCDDWISFTNGKENHYIRFTKGDSKLQPIKAFVDQLNAIKIQYASDK